MSDNALEPLMIAAGVFITCSVISIGTWLASTGASVDSSFGNRLTKINADISDVDLVQYDADNIPGSDVINCIRKYKDSMTISVTKITAVDGSTYTTQYSSLTGQFKNLPSQTLAYINPNAYYVGEVTKNANGVISSIAFLQTAYVADAGTGHAGSGGGGSGAGDGSEGSGGGSSGGSSTGGVSEATITTLMNTLESVRSQVEAQIIQQTKTINKLLEEFVALREDFNNASSSGGNVGSGNINDDSVNSALQSLTEQVSSMSDALNSLVSRFDLISATISDLSSKVDALGNNTGNSETENQTKIKNDISALEADVQALNTQLVDLKSQEITSENMSGVKSMTEQLRTQIASSQQIATELYEQVDGLSGQDVKELKTYLDSIDTLLSSMEQDAVAILQTLKLYGV